MRAMKRTFFKALIFAFIPVYALIFAEHFLRIFDPQALIPRYIMGADYGIRANIPNAIYYHITPEIDVEMKINSQGLRAERDYALPKPEGLCRVGIFGDSFFMSYEVSFENSFGNQLELLLNKNGQNCEVLNFAVSGFGTAESIIQFEKVAKEFDLDYAVLEWHHTDVADNIRSGLFRIENEQIVRHSSTYLPGVKTREKLMEYALYRWMIQNSHLYTAGREKLAVFAKSVLVDIKTKLGATRLPEQPSDNTAREKADPSRQEFSLDSLLIDNFNEIVSETGVTPILLDVPARTFNGEIESSYEHLSGRLRSEIIICSPYSDLVKLNAENTKLYFEQGHKHFTPVGYRTLADAAKHCILSKTSNYELK